MLAAGPAALALRQLRLAHEAAVIERSDWPVWLGEVDGDAIRLLRAAPDDVLRAWQVDRKVGNVRNYGSELIKPVAELEPTLLSPIWSAQARE